MRHWTIMAAAGIAAAPFAALGQFGNPGFADPSTPGIETGRPSGDAANAPDRVFLRQAAIGNRAEVELGNLARERASSAAVREFAGRMVTDHADALDEVESLARGSNTPLPRELDMDHEVVMRELRETDRESFDVAYIRSQIVDHQRTAQLLIYQIGSGQNPEVQSFAKQTLVGVMDHLEAAKRIHAELTGAAP